MIKLKNILLEQATQKQKEAQAAFLKYCKSFMPEPENYNTVTFSESKDKFLIFDKEKHTYEAAAKNQTAGRLITINYQYDSARPFAYSTKQTNKKGKVEVPAKWNTITLGWPVEIYGGYLGGYWYLDDKDSIFGDPREDPGTWHPNKLVWSQTQGLSSEFINNAPNNNWNCAYDKIKYFADNQTSGEYPNGIWDKIKSSWQPENGYDPKNPKCK
jgi:hypothetical protein